MGARTARNQNRKTMGKSDRPPLKPIKAKTFESPEFQQSDDGDEVWTPNIQTTFKALASARLCAAVWNNINDCDETYNYWEPMHYLVYGSGFQTWEYSPVYALRSYAYILLHAFPAWLYGLILQSNRVLVFYFLRCILGFICTTFETYFYKSVKHQFGPHVARLTLVFLLFSAGMFQSSSAFLPSSFSMYMCLVSMGAWFQKQYSVAIVTTAVSAFLSWPFAGILGIGIAVDLLFIQKAWKTFFSWCIFSVMAVLVPIVIIDSNFYGRLIVAPMNIVLYNIFSDHGPDLYGTSPWTFYFLNGFLNFNLVFPLALVALPVFLVTWKLKPIRSLSIPLWLALLPLYVWIGIFFSQPHKEERFLYPVYPLIGFAAAVTWTCIESLLSVVRLPEKMINYLTLGLLISSSALSVSRVIGQYKGYHAPMDVFLELNRMSWENEIVDQGSNVCIGKEWYRFPTSFFLPTNWKMLYLKSEFRGLLPRPYDRPPNGTSTIPMHMNDLNKEEPSRYASLKDCHYIIDSETSSPTVLEPRYSEMKDWETIFSVDFIESSRSSPIFRAFYVPWFSEKYVRTIPYTLLKRRIPAKKKWK